MCETGEIKFVVSSDLKMDDCVRSSVTLFELKDGRFGWGCSILDDVEKNNVHDSLGDIQQFCYLKPKDYILDSVDPDKGPLGNDVSDYLFIGKKNGTIDVIKDYKRKVLLKEKLITELKFTCNLLPFFRDDEKARNFEIISIEYSKNIMYCATKSGKLYAFFLNLPSYYYQANNFFDINAQDDKLLSILQEQKVDDNFREETLFEKLTSYVPNEGWQDICYFLQPINDTLKDEYNECKTERYFRPSLCIDIKRKINRCHINPLDKYSVIVSSNNIHLSIEKFNIPKYFNYWLISFLTKKNSTNKKIKINSRLKEDSIGNHRGITKPTTSRDEKLNRLTDIIGDYFKKEEDRQNQSSFIRNRNHLHMHGDFLPQFPSTTFENTRFDLEGPNSFLANRHITHTEFEILNKSVSILPSYICWEFKNDKQKNPNAVTFLERRSLRRRNTEIFNQILNYGGNWINTDDASSSSSNSSRTSRILGGQNKIENKTTLLDFYVSYNSIPKPHITSESEFLTQNYQKIKIISISKQKLIEIFKPKYQNNPTLKVDSFRYINDDTETLETFDEKLFRDKMTLGTLRSFQKVYKINEFLSLIIDEAGLIIINPEGIDDNENLILNDDNVLKIALFNFGPIVDSLVCIDSFISCMEDHTQFSTNNSECNDYSIFLTLIVTVKSGKLLALKGIFKSHSKVGKLKLIDSLVTKQKGKAMYHLQLIDYKLPVNMKKHYLNSIPEIETVQKKQK